MAPTVPQRMEVIKLGGNEQLIYDKDLVTSKQIRQLRLDIEKAIREYDERMDKMQKDFKDLVDKFSEEAKKKDKESEASHEKRVKALTEQFQKDSEAMRPPEDNYWLQDLAFDLLTVIARMHGQDRKITRDNFDGAPWNPIKEFLAKTLIEMEISAGTLFLPPRLSEEN